MHKIGYFSPLGYIALGYAIADRKRFIVDTINDEMVHDNHLMIANFPYTTTDLRFDEHTNRPSEHFTPREKEDKYSPSPRVLMSFLD